MRQFRLAGLLALPLMLLPAAAWAQVVSVDFGDGGQLTSRIVQLLALLTVLSLAPSILVMVTSFTRIVIVLSLLRSAMGVQQTPPNTVLVSLALFLTAFVMAPTFERAYKEGLAPLMAQEIDEFEAFDRTMVPVREFMIAHVREKDLALFVNMAGLQVSPPAEPAAAPGQGGGALIQEARADPAVLTAAEQVPLHVLIPAFIISELRRAFEIGFLIFVPFVVIDMVVASVLMSMGMMMLPPIMISLPFKLIFFVLVDGWNMITGSLVQSFG